MENLLNDELSPCWQNKEDFQVKHTAFELMQLIKSLIVAELNEWKSLFLC